MPNTFGSTGGGKPLIDPRCVREHRERFRRDCLPELELANSYYMSSGRWPDVGWLLLDRVSYSGIPPYSTNLRLTIQDYLNPPVIIDNLTVVQAKCVTRGLANDPNAIYLVQVTNGQGVIYNPWFQQSVNVQYNVRAPGYETELDNNQYYESTQDGIGNPWTWSSMIDDLWQRAAQLGTAPSVSDVPTDGSNPENFIFPGVPLWEAINNILGYLGLTVVGAYPNFDVVLSGASDPIFTAQQSLYRKYLEDDMEYIDTGAGRVPGSVVVYFHRRGQVYGIEETVRKDSKQWQTTPAYSITIPAPITFVTAGASGIGYLWDSFTVRYDVDGVPLSADVTMANTIATDRVNRFFNTIYRGTKGMMRQIYAGALPFTTGSLVDGVRWYNCGGHLTGYGTGKRRDDSAGWRTEIVRGYIWPEVTFPTATNGISNLV